MNFEGHPPIDPEELTGSVLNVRAISALEGDAVAVGTDIASTLIELLVSDHDIDRATRLALADALDRGMDPHETPVLNDEGREMPLLAVRGLGRSGRANKAEITRWNWMHAVDALLLEDPAGRSMTDRMLDVGRRHGLDFDAMKKARRFHSRFLRTLEMEGSPILAWLRENDLLDHADDWEGGDFQYLARRAFIELEIADIMNGGKR